jgi:hypothetical protein
VGRLVVVGDACVAIVEVCFLEFGEACGGAARCDCVMQKKTGYASGEEIYGGRVKQGKITIFMRWKRVMRYPSFTR